MGFDGFVNNLAGDIWSWLSMSSSSSLDSSSWVQERTQVYRVSLTATPLEPWEVSLLAPRMVFDLGVHSMGMNGVGSGSGVLVLEI